MTVREILQRIADYTTDLDKEVKVRIANRDGEGCVVSVKHVPISGFYTFNREPCIVVDNFDLLNTLFERA